VRRIGVLLALALTTSSLVAATVPRRGVASTPSRLAGTTTTTYLSDLAWISASTGRGDVRRDTNHNGSPIKLRGKTYAKGLGVYPRSEVTFALDGGYTSFRAELGIDDLCGGAGTVTFEVYLDDARAYTTGKITGATATRLVSLDTTGVDRLRLLLTDGGDGVTCEYADWADAQLLSSTALPPSTTTPTTTTTTPATTTPPSTAPLTTFSLTGDPTIVGRKQQQIQLHADRPFPSDFPERQIGEAYAELLLADADPNTPDARQFRAEALIAELYGGGGPAGFPNFGTPPAVTGWTGEFVSPVFLRMWVDHPELRARLRAESASQMTAMIRKFVDFACHLTPDELAPALADPWYRRNTENLMVMRRTNCLLGSYFLHQEAGGNDPEWTGWRDHLIRFLQERAKNGLLDEIASPQYGKFTVAALYGLVDFPGDAEIRRLANEYLDLFWHDVAHDFNRRTGVPGAAGTRTYQLDPANEAGDPKGYYRQPTKHWARQWLYVYAWHDIDPGNQTHPMIMNAAGSSYEPLGISRALAVMTGKNFEYASRRPTRLGATVGQSHFIRRDVSVNDDFMTGAVTFDPNPAHKFSKSGVEAMWFSAAANGDLQHADERIMISGVAATKPGSTAFADYHGVTGTAFRDVIVAARDKRAENTVGVRVYLGTGDFCANLVPDDPSIASKWFFTRSGNTYAAIRIADARLDQYKGTCNGVANKTMSLRIDGGEDIWAPVVVQLGRASSYGNNFETFKAAVKARWYSYANGVVTYVSLRNSKFELRRQEAGGSLPKLDDQTRSTSPAKAYDSPYLSMTWGSPFATARGPSGSCVVLNFSSPPQSAPAC
jgi:hypothetical protein